MDDYLYEKTENGFILRQRYASLIAVAVVCVCCGLILPVEMLCEWAQGKPSETDVTAAVAIFLTCAVPGIWLPCFEWRRIDLNEHGIWFHRPLVKTKFIAWKDVQDWGILYKFGGRASWYVLYFSAKPLKPTRRERNKRLPLTYRNTVYIRIESGDLDRLKSEKILPFCRRHLGWDKGHIPMFTSDGVNPL